MDIGERIYICREELGLTLEDVGNAVGVGKSTVRKWETGDIANMRRDKIASLANILNVSPSYLMGWTDKPETSRKIPIIGTIVAGTPLYAEQHVEHYCTVPTAWDIDYGLKARGMSMVDADIPDGSIVLCKHQQDVDDGQIAVCIIDGENATLKRIKRYGDILVLHPENPDFKDLIFKGRDKNDVKIVGHVLKVIKDV